jgi:tetratricopeptide (TPR) repeat protein
MKIITKTGTKITLVLFGLGLFLVILEIGLRLGGFILISVQEHRNNLSLRQKGAYRIMCIGESTTQDQYPVFLEEFLNQSGVGIKFSVIDKGLSGDTTSTILAQLPASLDKYRPDMVVAMMGINDQGQHLPYAENINSKPAPFFRSLRTYKLARLLWRHLLTKAKENRKGSQAGIPPIEGPLKEPVKPGPKNPDAYIQSGCYYRDQGKFSQAIDCFKKAIDLNPGNYRAYIDLGVVYEIQSKFPEAEDLFKKAIKLNPQNNASAYCRLGYVYCPQGKFLQSEEAFNKALQLSPDNNDIYLGLGYLYKRQGKFLQSEEAFKKALELSPDNDIICIALANLYQEEEKFSQALSLFKKAAQLNPENDKACAGILILSQQLNKPELAKKYAKKLEAIRSGYYNPTTVDNYRKLKAILDKRGVRLVCVQYPMRNVEPLKKIFSADSQGVIFVDNERIFKEEVRKGGYKQYFMDIFGVDFGHCKDAGNRFLAQNIADTIIREVFKK